MRGFYLNIFFSLLLISGQGYAHTPEEEFLAPEEKVLARSQVMHYEEIGLFDSMEGETKNQFMTRVAQGLLDFTLKTGYEGCGMVQYKYGGGWRVRLTTTRSQVACLRVAFQEDNFTAMPEFIHSHPATTKINLSPLDAGLIRRQPYENITVLPSEYSPNDIKNGGGWLVVPKFRFGTNARLLYRGESYTQVIAKNLKPLAMHPSDTKGQDAYVLKGTGETSSLQVVHFVN